MADVATGLSGNAGCCTSLAGAGAEAVSLGECGRTVLLVEDDESVRLLVREVLTELR